MITVITRKQPPCPYCTAAKSLLDMKEIEYVELELDEALLEKFREMGIKTVPAIFVGKKVQDEVILDIQNYIGGYAELQEYLKNDA